ncbi:MAG: serine hydrolase [Actinomycetota bacterium]|nr:serine hydrolase [Actinomycetota bacterium]
MSTDTVQGSPPRNDPVRNDPVPEGIVRDGAPRPGPTRAEREIFLDLLRSIALVRVVAWHTLASAVISWTIAAMPTMFFVAGSLMAASLDRRPARRTFVGRFRRLLVPYWVFSGVVLSVLAAYHQLHPSKESGLAPVRLLAWIVPLLDPQAPDWTGGWVSDPLWYLRCYLWLVLLSPLLLALYRRKGLWIALVPAAAVFAVDLGIRSEAAPDWFRQVQWYAGDLVTYSTFWILGFAHRDGRLRRIDVRGRWEWAAVGGTAALLWVSVVRVPGMVVNNSYPLMLFVGTAWLSALFALEPRLTAVALHRWVRPVVSWMTRRAVSVYLWHPVAVVGVYWVARTWLPDVPTGLVLLLVAPATVALAVLFGRAEDLAARRTPQWWPSAPDPGFGAAGRLVGACLRTIDRGRPGPLLAAGLVLGWVAAAFLLPVPLPATASSAATGAGTATGVKLPPPPSGKPDVAVFTGPGEGATSPSSSPSAAGTPGATPSASASAAGTGAKKTAATGRVVPGQPVAAGPAEGKPAEAQMTARILAAADAWRAAKSVDGVLLAAILPDGSVATAVSGTGTGGKQLAVTDRLQITSVTKSMTAAIVLQLVGEKRLALDDPLPNLTKRPKLPWTGKVTIRQLLNHTAGVKPYDKTAGYAAARGGPLTPVTALDLVAADPAPLEWTPGSQAGYSNSGYLTLGLLVEQITGKPYAELLATRVFTTAGMTSSTLDETPSAGWSGFSAGGVTSTVSDLLAWGNTLFRRQTVLPVEQLGEMTDVTNPFSAGLGAFPACPCAEVDGVRVYTSIGHNGGQTTVAFSPGDGMVIAGWLTESMWSGTPTQEDVYALLASVRTAVTSAR